MIKEKSKKYGPIIIYYDFVKEGNISTSSTKENSTNEIFLRKLCTFIEEEISSRGFFSLEKEVSEVWEEIINEKRDVLQKNSALSFIVKELRIEDSQKRNLQPENVYKLLAKRKKIRKKLMSDLDRRISYLALIINYIRKEKLDNDEMMFTIIIDNLDRETTILQNKVKTLIKPLSLKLRGRIILFLRQTTYYQQLEDSSSAAVDTVAFCGPDLIDVIKRRLDYFINKPKEYAKNIDDENINDLIHGIEYIKNILHRSETLRKLMKCFCGRCIRTGLLLTQNLIYNSVYSPFQMFSQNNASEALYSLSDLIRALIVGADKTFITTPNNIIDNLFEVKNYYLKSYLIKLRILILLSKLENDGVTISKIMEITNYFGYDRNILLVAINEMKVPHRNLIWSDSVKDNFRDIEDLINHSRSKLFISESGKGYVKELSRDLNYIQEIMLDTDVSERRFGKNYDYDEFYQRFELIRNFVDLLIRQDIVETKIFISKLNQEEYEMHFRSDIIFSKNILNGVYASLDRILLSMFENAETTSSREFISTIRMETEDWFKEKNNEISNIEQKLFN